MISKPGELGNDSGYGGITPLGWVLWILLSIVDWFVFATIYGTVEHYFTESIPMIIFGFTWFLSVQWLVMLAGFSIWGVITIIIFKIFNIKRYVKKRRR